MLWTFRGGENGVGCYHSSLYVCVCICEVLKNFKNANINNSFKDQMYMLKFLVELDQSG